MGHASFAPSPQAPTAACYALLHATAVTSTAQSGQVCSQTQADIHLIVPLFPFLYTRGSESSKRCLASAPSDPPCAPDRCEPRLSKLRQQAAACRRSSVGSTACTGCLLKVCCLLLVAARRVAEQHLAARWRVAHGLLAPLFLCRIREARRRGNHCGMLTRCPASLLKWMVPQWMACHNE